MKRLFIVLLLFPFSFLYSEIHFGAKEVIYLPSEKIVILKDSAWTFDKNNHLNADSIIYFEDSSLLKAFGHAILITGKDSFIGDSLYYDTNRKQGYAFNGYTLKEKGKIWGDQAYKDSSNNIYIKHGFYTTCDAKVPHYYFQSSYMKVVNKEMAIAKPVILKVHDVPLFYVPFWMFPVKKGRKSGFLTPSVGVNSSSGKYFRNLAYYLVINNYMDATLSLDLVENVGIRGNIDFVYKLYKRLGGEIKYSRAQNLWSGQTEWSINGWHKQNLPYKAHLSAKFDYVSSYDYLNQYSESVVEWLKKEMYSYLTITRNIYPIPFTITLDDRLKPDRKTRESLLPLVQYYSPAMKFLNIRLSGNLIRKRYEDTVNVYYRQGISNNISASYNLNFLKYIRFQTGLNSSLNILPVDTSMNNYTLQKSMRLSGALATTLYGFSVFGMPFIKVKKFVHILSPQVSFGYTPSMKNDSVFFQYGSLYREGRSLSIHINNTFLAKTDSGKVKLLDLNLSSSYDFTNKKWSKVPVNFSLSDKLPVKIRGNFTYSIDSGKVYNPSVYMSSNFSIKLPRTSFMAESSEDTQSIKNTNKLHASISYNISRMSTYTTQTIALSSGFRITPTVSGGFNISYDLEKGKYLNKSFNLKKDLHCWELTFSYNKYGDIWDYSFRLFIKEIPDIKIDKGFIKDLLP